MNEQEREDSVYYTTRTDKPRRMDAPYERDAQQRNRDWRHGVSKAHKLPCQRCDGRLHEPGKHFSIGSLQAMQAKAERERQRAAACGAGRPG